MTKSKYIIRAQVLLLYRSVIVCRSDLACKLGLESAPGAPGMPASRKAVNSQSIKDYTVSPHGDVDSLGVSTRQHHPEKCTIVSTSCRSQLGIIEAVQTNSRSEMESISL